MGVYNLSSGEGSSRKRSRKKNNSTPSGCMNAVFQLFDLNHYFNFPLNSSSSSTSNTTTDHPRPLQGVVAPRNSLEIEDTTNMEGAALSSSSSVKNQKSLQLQMGGIQIKTRVSTSTDQDLSSSSESAYTSGSPAGTKTPTLVARLMGLDLLPETSSPRPSSSSSSSKSHLLQKSQTNNKRSVPRNNNHDAGTRSLPETPRTSSSARRSDVDQRFSLQMNKENSQLSGNEFEFSKFLTAKIAAATSGRPRDENMSPGHYAKQIVKQFKDSVSRRVGRDITNTVENRSEQRRDQHVVLLKLKKPTSSHDQQDSCSPKLKVLEIKNISTTSTHSPKLSAAPSPLSHFVDNRCKSVTVSSSSKDQSVAVVQEKQIRQSSVVKKTTNDHKYGSRVYMMPQISDLIRTKQEESFVKSSASCRAKSRHINIPDKKCKNSTPLSNVPTILTVKKDPSPPATRLPHQQEGQRQHQSSQSQVKNSPTNGPPSCLSHQIMYKQKGTRHTVPHLVTHCNNSNVITGELYQYISRILKRTGIEDYTAVSIANWYSPSHPLDPSIFHQLKVSETSTIEQCKLVFDVANEILAGILKARLNWKPWTSWNGINHVSREREMSGSQLINTLCGRIRSLPSADCRVLEDIDGLIDTDFGGSWESYTYEEEFGDGIVGDIEGDILDLLMHETLLDIALVSVR